MVPLLLHLSLKEYLALFQEISLHVEKFYMAFIISLLHVILKQSHVRGYKSFLIRILKMQIGKRILLQFTT